MRGHGTARGAGGSTGTHGWLACGDHTGRAGGRAHGGARLHPIQHVALANVVNNNRGRCGGAHGGIAINHHNHHNNHNNNNNNNNNGNNNNDVYNNQSGNLNIDLISHKNVEKMKEEFGYSHYIYNSTNFQDDNTNENNGNNCTAFKLNIFAIEIIKLIYACSDQLLNFVNYKLNDDIQSLRILLTIAAETITCSIKEENNMIREWKQYTTHGKHSNCFFRLFFSCFVLFALFVFCFVLFVLVEIQQQ